jgi:hypothetical protein
MYRYRIEKAMHCIKKAMQCITKAIHCIKKAIHCIGIEAMQTDATKL